MSPAQIDLTWARAKDALLIGLLSLSLLLIRQLSDDVHTLQTRIAAYQERLDGEIANRQDLKRAVDGHLAEDRERWLRIMPRGGQ